MFFQHFLSPLPFTTSPHHVFLLDISTYNYHSLFLTMSQRAYITDILFHLILFVLTRHNSHIPLVRISLHILCIKWLGAHLSSWFCWTSMNHGPFQWGVVVSVCLCGCGVCSMQVRVPAWLGMVFSGRPFDSRLWVLSNSFQSVYSPSISLSRQWYLGTFVGSRTGRNLVEQH